MISPNTERNTRRLASELDAHIHESWSSLDEQTRAHVIADLRRAGHLRDCLTGGHTVDLGDAYPQFAADQSELERVVAQHLVRARVLCGF